MAGQYPPPPDPYASGPDPYSPQPGQYPPPGGSPSPGQWPGPSQYSPPGQYQQPGQYAPPGQYQQPGQGGGYQPQGGGYQPQDQYQQPGQYPQYPGGQYPPGQYPPSPYPPSAAGPYGPGYAAGVSPYASWIQRVGAYLVDIAPQFVLLLIFERIFALYLIIWLASLGWTIYNRWYQGGTTGQSLGKKVLNIRLVSEQTGQPIGVGMAFLRDICHFVDSIICFVGYLFPLWDAKRQTLADKIVRTVVVPA